MTIQKIMIGGFWILALVFAAIIFKLNAKDEKNWTANVAINAKIVNIREGYKGKPNYKIMELSDNQSFAIPKIMLGKLQIGDSVFKQKDSSFFLFIKAYTKEKIVTDYQ